MRHRWGFFSFFLHRLHSGYFFQYIDSHDLTRLGSLYQSCFSESAGTEFADCMENCTHINSLVSNLLRCLLSIETEIVETGTQFCGIRRYTRPARKVVKEKETDKTQRRLEDAMPSQWVSIPCYIVRPAIIGTYPRRSRDQSQGDIRIPSNRTPYKASRRVSLSLSLSVPLFGHVRTADNDTNSSRAFEYIARACIEQQVD